MMKKKTYWIKIYYIYVIKLHTQLLSYIWHEPNIQWYSRFTPAVKLRTFIILLKRKSLNNVVAVWSTYRRKFISRSFRDPFSFSKFSSSFDYFLSRAAWCRPIILTNVLLIVWRHWGGNRVVALLAWKTREYWEIETHKKIRKKVQSAWQLV